MKIVAKVHTNSPDFKTEMRDGVLHIWCTQPAENNKANREIVKELSKKFGGCTIVSGLKSSKKVLNLP